MGHVVEETRIHGYLGDRSPPVRAGLRCTRTHHQRTRNPRPGLSREARVNHPDVSGDPDSTTPTPSTRSPWHLDARRRGTLSKVHRVRQKLLDEKRCRRGSTRPPTRASTTVGKLPSNPRKKHAAHTSLRAPGESPGAAHPSPLLSVWWVAPRAGAGTSLARRTRNRFDEEFRLEGAGRWRCSISGVDESPQWPAPLSGRPCPDCGSDPLRRRSPRDPRSALLLLPRRGAGPTAAGRGLPSGRLPQAPSAAPLVGRGGRHGALAVPERSSPRRPRGVQRLGASYR